MFAFVVLPGGVFFASFCFAHGSPFSTAKFATAPALTWVQCAFEQKILEY